MRVVADRATFPQGLVFEHKGAGLFPMTGGATLVVARQRQAAGGLQDIATMWIVTLHAIHPAFEDWMMLRQVELRMDVEMTTEARLRIAARIHDESFPAGCDVLAPGPVARLATDASGLFQEIPGGTSSPSHWFCIDA